jgi:hypothetical protein
MSDPEWWHPCFAAVSSILDILPPEYQRRAAEQLQQMAQCCEDRGDTVSAYFCRALSGEEFPEAKPKPRPQHLKLVK